LDQLGLTPLLSLPRRLARRPPPPSPALSTPQRLRLALEALGPTFVKLGQILSTRPDLLPPDYIAELSRLQDTVPPVPWETIQNCLEEELGTPLSAHFASFDPQPIAAASLAQVHPATLRDGTEVVVKVQRPHIRQVIETDLEILSDLAWLAQQHTPLGELYDLPEIAEEFAYTLRAELDYRREGRNADRFRENFADEPALYIPQVYWETTTRRVLTLERIRGIKIDDIEALDAAGYDRKRIALHAARIIIQEVLVDGFFHADPHPGNFVVMPGEVIGAMDFGMVGYLDRRLREDLVRLYIAAVQMDSEAVAERLIRMGAARQQVDRNSLSRDIARLLRKYQGLPLKEIRAQEVVRDIMPIAFRHHLRLPSDLWLLGKTLGMMEGVGLKLDPDFDIFAVSEPYVRRLMRQVWLPDHWGPSLLRGITDWAELTSLAPRQAVRLLEQAERGELQIRLRLQELEETTARMDRMASRLALSILVAAFIVALALLIPALNLNAQWGIITWLVILGFIVASFLGLWLLITIWRAGRWR